MGRGPTAEVEVTAGSRTLRAKLREIRAKFATFGGELKKNIFGKDLVEKGFMSKAGAQMVGNLGSSAATAIGGFVVDQGRDVLGFNDALKRLEITATRTPEEMDAFAKSVRKSSSDFGISAAEILEGSTAYVALTGDMDGAAASARTWTRVAQATNSQVGDIAKTAAALKQQLRIKPEEMEGVFSALAAQGKEGAIELKDLASELSSIAPQWGEFAGGRGVQGVKEMGAALQIVKRGFGGDAGETVTGLQSLLNALVKNAARLKKGGVQIFETDPKTGEKHMRNVLEIMDSLANSKLAKDPTKMEKALGRVEAYRAYLQLKENRGELQRIIEAGNDAGLIQRDLDKYMGSSAGKVKTGWQQAKNEIADAFTPERIEAFTSAAVKAAGAAATMVGVMSGAMSVLETLGKDAAKLIGGESEEDRITKLRAKRIDERKAQIGKRYDAQHPNADKDDEDYRVRREAAIRMELGNEQYVLNQVSAQARGETISRIVPNRTEGPLLPGQSRPDYEDLGNYSVAELLRLKDQTRGSSDEKMLAGTIDAAVSKMLAAQADAWMAWKEMLSGRGGTGAFGAPQIGPIQVNADGKAIVEVAANSKAHARGTKI